MALRPQRAISRNGRHVAVEQAVRLQELQRRVGEDPRVRPERREEACDRCRRQQARDRRAAGDSRSRTSADRRPPAPTDSTAQAGRQPRPQRPGQKQQRYTDQQRHAEQRLRVAQAQAVHQALIHQIAVEPVVLVPEREVVLVDQHLPADRIGQQPALQPEDQVDRRRRAAAIS